MGSLEALIKKDSDMMISKKRILLLFIVKSSNSFAMTMLVYWLIVKENRIPTLRMVALYNQWLIKKLQSSVQRT